MAKKLTNKEFVIRIENRNIINLDEYVTSQTKIRFYCEKCHNEWSAKPNNILSGKGCPECGKKSGAEKLVKTNDIIEDNGDWVLIDISTPTHPCCAAKFDKGDFLCFGRRVYMGDQGYPVVHPKGSRKTVKAHRLINPSWKVTDHINGKKTDNRRINLRECTIRQNARNSSVSRSNTGTRGVTWKKNRKKYLAYIGIDYETKWLGYFDKLDDAKKARKDAEVEYYGDFKRQEFVK